MLTTKHLQRELIRLHDSKGIIRNRIRIRNAPNPIFIVDIVYVVYVEWILAHTSVKGLSIRIHLLS